MPNDTGAPFFIPYNDDGDKPPSLEAVTKPIAERVHELLEEIGLGQLVVPGGTGDDGKLVMIKDGAAVLQAMKGDATIAEDGTLAIGVSKVTTAMLVDLAVTTAKLANLAVTEGKLANLAATTAKIANEAITTGKVAPLAITEAKIAAEAVTTPKIKDGAVTEPKLGDAAATSRKVKPTMGSVSASGDLTLTTAYQDVPGAVLEIAPAVPSKLLIEAAFDLRASTGANSAPENNFGRALGAVRLNAEDLLTRLARVEIRREGPMYRIHVRNTVTVGYVLDLAAGANVIKLRAKKESEGGTDQNQANCFAAGTAFTYMLFAA